MSSDIELYGDSQSVYLSKEDNDVFETVDEVISATIASKSPAAAFQYGRKLQKGVRVAGVAMAKLMWSLQDEWKNLDRVDDDLYSTIEAEMGYKPQTTEVYIRTWENIFANPEIPDKVKERLICMPIRTLKLLPALAGGDYEFEWSDITGADGHEDVRRVIKEIKGEATSSKTAMFIRYNVRTGQLSVKQGDAPFENFGVLTTDRSNPLVGKAIDRLISGGRIMVV